MMSDIGKFKTAIKNLKSNVEWSLKYAETDTEMTETLFNTIDWGTGKDADDTAITTKTNPHSEITWDKVSEEMSKL
tara:strand:- start:59 stop:286 length:228 start_codon:yes stop_codon:yes gene_type:complete